MSKPTRLIAGLAAGAVTFGTAVTSAAVLSPAEAAETTITDFAFQATAYGSRVTAQGGTLVSGSTAYAWLGCIKRAGVEVDRALGQVSLPTADDPYISLSAIESHLDTYRRTGGGVDAGVTSTNIIGGVALGNASTPRLAIDRLQATSRAWSTLNGTLQATNQVSSGAISLTGVTDPGDGTPLGDLIDAVEGGMDDVLATISEHGGSIEIPNLGTLHLGTLNQVLITSRHAVAQASVLRVDLYGPDGNKDTTGDNSTVDIGHSRARINRDLNAGVLGGRAYSADADLVDETLAIGQLGDLPLPCRGTDGEINRNPVAGFTGPDDQFVLGGLEGRTFGETFDSGAARAWTAGTVSSVTIGTLQISGIVGRVNLRQDHRGRIVRNDLLGSSVGEIVVDGESLGSFGPADGGPLPADQLPPGIAKIELFKRLKGTRSNQVTAVTITFAEGTPGVSVLRLGYARARISRY